MNDPDEIAMLFAPEATIDIYIPQATVPIAGYTVELVDGVAHRRRDCEVENDIIVLQFATTSLNQETCESLMKAIAPIPGVLRPDVDMTETGIVSMQFSQPGNHSDRELFWLPAPDLTVRHCGRDGSELYVHVGATEVRLTHSYAWCLIEVLAAWQAVDLALRDVADSAFDAGLVRIGALLDQQRAAMRSHATS